MMMTLFIYDHYSIIFPFTPRYFQSSNPVLFLYSENMAQVNKLWANLAISWVLNSVGKHNDFALALAGNRTRCCWAQDRA
jgi:hypothetical protein